MISAPSVTLPKFPSTTHDPGHAKATVCKLDAVLIHIIILVLITYDQGNDDSNQVIVFKNRMVITLLILLLPWL